MTIVKIDNGFDNHGGKGILLTGKLISGRVLQGDKLIVSESQKIPILEVEYPPGPTPGTTEIVLTMARDTGVVWSNLYHKEFKIET